MSFHEDGLWQSPQSIAREPCGESCAEAIDVIVRIIPTPITRERAVMVLFPNGVRKYFAWYSIVMKRFHQEPPPERVSAFRWQPTHCVGVPA
jgi:hypothetical protein